MGQSPDQLRREIDSLRDDLSTLVEAVGERVSPKRVARRSANSVGATMRSVKGSVMGTAEDATGTIKAKSRQAKRGAQRKLSGPSSRSSSGSRSAGRGRNGRAASRSGQQNRPAVGLLAMGAGMLAASLLPASQAETEALEDLKAGTMRLRDDLVETGRSMVAGMQPELEHSKELMMAKGQRSSVRVARSATNSSRKVQSHAKAGAQRTKTRAESAARRAS